MTTLDFLWKNINADADITIAKANGDIVYEGTACEMDFNLIDYTTVERIDLGAHHDLIITIKEAQR